MKADRDSCRDGLERMTQRCRANGAQPARASGRWLAGGKHAAHPWCRAAPAEEARLSRSKRKWAADANRIGRAWARGEARRSDEVRRAHGSFKRFMWFEKAGP